VVTETKVVEEIEDRYETFNADDTNVYKSVDLILSNREHEKHELQRLNDRLAKYLEDLHRLEWEGQSLDSLKGFWEKNVAAISVVYQKEVHESQRQLEESAKIRTTLEGQIFRIQSELAGVRKQFDEAVRDRDGNLQGLLDFSKQLSDREAELNGLKRQIELLEGEVARLKAENARLRSELDKIRADTLQQAHKTSEYENHVQTLLQKLAHLRRDYDLEITELRSKSITFVPPADYKSDLSKAIAELRRDFEALNNKKKGELHLWYSQKIKEYQTTNSGPYLDEIKRVTVEIDSIRIRTNEFETKNGLLKTEIQNLQLLMESEKHRYHTLFGNSETELRRVGEENDSLKEKLLELFRINRRLQAEIEVYRKLLDGETVSKKPVVVSKQEKEKEEMHIIKEEQVAHTKFERANKGNVKFCEISKEGKYIVLENTSFAKEEDISGYKLVRKLDNRHEVSFTFPPRFLLAPGNTVKIWANHQGGVHNPPESLIFEDISTWGVGQNVATTLVNREGEERAHFNQVTVTSQRTLSVS